LLLTAVTVVVACRVTNTDATTPVTQVLAFWPWLFAPAVLATVLAAFARSLTGLTWGIVLLGLLAWYVEPYGRVSEPHGTPVADVRVLEANVHVGEAAPALVETMRKEHPDLVFVPECTPACTAALDKAFGAGTDAGAGSRAGKPGTYPYRVGEQSGESVILSRYPLHAAPSVPGTLAMPGAVAGIAGHQVRLQLAHPMPPKPRGVDLWRTELGRLRDFAASAVRAGGPVVLAGDFNASQDHAAFRRILDTGLRDSARLAGAPRTPSWPSATTPTFGTQIDHVLVSKDFSAGEARFLRLAGSDHRALLTRLTLHS
jgi:endonuclease/exonuclease/phosphatase (EEP) superfamily protein YafD